MCSCFYVNFLFSLTLKGNITFSRTYLTNTNAECIIHYVFKFFSQKRMQRSQPKINHCFVPSPSCLNYLRQKYALLSDYCNTDLVIVLGLIQLFFTYTAKLQHRYMLFNYCKGCACSAINYNLFFIRTICYKYLLWTCAQPEIRIGGSCLGGLGAKPPAAGGTGVWGSPELENFAFFCKNNLTLGLFWWKILLLKRGIEISDANLIKLVA